MPYHLIIYVFSIVVHAHLQSSAELIGVGQRCLGEKHNEVIDNQREAIRRLKHELQNSAKPPGTSCSAGC